MRPSQEEYFMAMAKLVATRATCVRRAVGAVAINARGHVIATGYNGNPVGLPHCNEGHPCVAAKSASGADLDRCQAVHAEINMLAQCRDVWEIERVYVTTSPCMSCMKALVSSSCRVLYVGSVYAGGEDALVLWKAVGKDFYKI